MNNFKKQVRIAMVMLITLTLLLSIAIPVLAAEQETQPSGWNDPMLYVFMAVVVAFFGVIGGAIFIYLKVKKHQKLREYKESEATIKIYDDLEDHKWDAPDTVFLDAMPPTAAILTEFVPARPVYGMNGFVITETPIEPEAAMRMGADPFAVQPDKNVLNGIYESVESITLDDSDLASTHKVNIPGANLSAVTFGTAKEQDEPKPEYKPTSASAVFEDVNYTVLEDGHLVSEPVFTKPTKPTTQHPGAFYSSPITYYTTNNTPVSAPIVNEQAAVYENTVASVTLEDTIIPAASVSVSRETAMPKSKPRTYLDVPITILTSHEDDGVVQINAAVYENTVSATTLEDEIVAPVAKTVPIMVATTPAADPVTRTFAHVDTPVELPTAEAAVYEDSASAIVLEDAKVEAAGELFDIPVVDVSPSEPLNYVAVHTDAPVEMPTEEAAVYEDTVSATTLADEIIPVAETPIVVAAVTTPSADPVSRTFVNADEPVVLPSEEAAVYEDTVSATVLEDVIIPVVEEPVVISSADNSPSEPLNYIASYTDAPVEMPTEEAAVYENTVSATVLEDEIIPVVETPVVIAAATTPSADPVSRTFVNADEPVVLPSEEAAVYEDTVSATVLEDVIIPVVEEPMVISSADNSPSAPFTYIASNENAPVEMPTEEAAVYENTVSATTLADEIIPVVETPVVIAAATTPSADPVSRTFVNADEPIVLPSEEAAVYEDTVSATVLEDEIIPVVETPAVITEATTSAADPFTYLASNESAPVEMPTEEAAVYENTVSAITLEDEVVPVAEIPVVLSAATTPSADPVSRTFVNADEPVVLPSEEAAVYEDTVSATVLEDEVVPVAETPVVISTVTTPSADPVTHNFVSADEPVVLPTESVAVYENTVSAITLEDEVVPVAETPVVISTVTTPSADPVTHNFVTADEPVVLPTEGAAVYENTVSAITLEDEVVPVSETPVVISTVTTPSADPLTHNFVTADEPVVLPTEGAAVFENTVTTTLIEETKYTTVIDESIIETPVVLSVFEAAESNGSVTDGIIKEEVTDLDYIELTSIDKPVEKYEVIKTVNTTVLNDNDEVILQVTERSRVPETIVIADEVIEEIKPKATKTTSTSKNIPTIEMDENGNVAYSEPAIPTLPPMESKGVGSNAHRAENPFVLPATPEARSSMAGVPGSESDNDSSDNKPSGNEKKVAPIAPILDIEDIDPANEESVAQSEPAPQSNDTSNAVVADVDLNLDFGDFEEEEPVYNNLPEMIAQPTPAEEPAQEEPAAEPEALAEEPEAPAEEPEIPAEEPEAPAEVEEPSQPVEEPAEEPMVEPEIQESVEEPIQIDATHVDDMMTDEEAKEHIEIIENDSHGPRKGKMHSINLDTICDSFEDGETVTLEALKAKKLAPANCGRLKILARGVMNKKLDIVADNYSLQAVKMITLAGGRSEQYK